MVFHKGGESVGTVRRLTKRLLTCRTLSGRSWTERPTARISRRTRGKGSTSGPKNVGEKTVREASLTNNVERMKSEISEAERTLVANTELVTKLESADPPRRQNVWSS